MKRWNVIHKIKLLYDDGNGRSRPQSKIPANEIESYRYLKTGSGRRTR
ncbi:MAG: hypothetical protein SRB1_00530 [Desulfobacteraceae bacterium Eth-SRB1]|nr:MAG: hypothetical protein SRB1_00530 [Desulfobacteraceae bacterium Eth-SRB1]